VNRIFKKTVVVHLSKNTTTINIFLYCEIDFFHILNIFKNMTYNFIKYIFKMMKTHKIKDIVFKNVSSYNLDIAPKIGSSQ